MCVNTHRSAQKVKIDGHTEPQLVKKHLLHVSVSELYNNLVRATKDGGLKEVIDEDDNIIISDSTLRSLFPTQFLKRRESTRSCMVGNVAYLPKLYIYH